MNKKNSKIILFASVFIFIVFGIVIYFMGNKSSHNQIPTNQQVEEFNTIVNNVSSQDDIEKCDDIGNDELEGLCKSQLKNRFSPLYSADNISICLSDKDILKQDMCILDLAYNKAKAKSETGLCNEIKTQDIKDACFSQIKNKKF